MRNLVIMPAMAQNREKMNLGEYAEVCGNNTGCNTIFLQW